MMGKVKITAFTLIIAVAGILSSCGQEANTSTTAGQAGPTTPSGYYFDLTLSPSVIRVDGSLSITVKVTRPAGVPVTTSPVISISGMSSPGSITADAVTGIATNIMTVSGAEGGYTGYVTATLEDKSLTLPYLVSP